MSMDHLRNKLRKSGTEDLEPQRQALPTGQLSEDMLPSTSDLPSTEELSEAVLSQNPSARAVKFDSEEPAPPKKAKVKPAKKEKAPRVKKAAAGGGALEALKKLDVNRKMLFVSLGVAAVASLLSMVYINGISGEIGKNSQPIEIVSLKKDVPSRTILTEDMIEVKKVPALYVPEKAIRYKQGMKLLGQVSTTSLYEGEILMTGRVALPNSKTGLAMQIPKGHRAMTIEVNNARLMKPSDHVDIISSIQDLNPARRGKIITLPILQRTLILAVGDQFSAESEEGNNDAREITVAVPDEKVKLMSILKSKGDYDVYLRPPGETKVEPDIYTVQEMEDALLGKFEKPVAPTPTPKPTVAPVVDTKPVAPPAPLVDYSRKAPTTYRKPVYRKPAAKPVYRKPAAKPVYKAPAKPKTVNVISGGTLTQVNGGTSRKKKKKR